MTGNEAEEDMLKWATAYAKKHGYTLNPDEKQLGTVIRGLVRNKGKFGRPYCPCRLRSGDEEKDRAIECPCVYHKEEIAKDGSCHCRLYYKT
ncbi:MAG TPA: ferredoxin-thioredoxin reductase catalytic domain-containing protein [Methanoregulaceae archaeon]|nr:ferredoxin-thioredoxin reductase catalytic domain-containing protein [Methanoregulaceae archaeon]HPD75279.1 ferredoxin-thioredoxin reductase catalytic domain-containing protein [Methanoregulaceae archaeon]HRY74797.1 ferredoxin-thioredoxin reductase catalytic domain-containing protein [Methanoregulaceae archaeon]